MIWILCLSTNFKAVSWCMNRELAATLLWKNKRCKSLPELNQEDEVDDEATTVEEEEEWAD